MSTINQNAGGGLTVDRDSLHASDGYRRQIEALRQLQDKPMITEELRKAVERSAWDLYCKETAGCMDARDFWSELSPAMQQHYIARITAHLGGENNG